MALFFDQEWFDAKLASVGATRDDIARLLQMTAEQVNELWKDQRELTALNVAKLARFLNASPDVIALKAGISTPVPPPEEQVQDRIKNVEMRLDRIESLLLELNALVKSRQG